MPETGNLTAEAEGRYRQTVQAYGAELSETFCVV